METKIIQIAEEFELKPYVRMTQRSKWVNKYAIAYMNNQAELKLILRGSMNRYGQEPVPYHIPFNIKIFISQTNPLHKCDLDNQVKAVLDAGQGILFPNDFWCDKIEAGRIQTVGIPFLQIWIEYNLEKEIHDEL